MIWRILVPLFASIGVFAAGGKIIGDIRVNRVKVDYQAKILELGRESTRLLDEKDSVIDVREGELDQCRGQVDKFNQATAANAARIAQEIREAARRDREAERRAAMRDDAAAERAAIAFETLAELKRKLENGDYTGCAAEPAGADLLGMLNAAIAAAEGTDVP
jgi:hypothetical protein